jgi:hypothetical protein
VTPLLPQYIRASKAKSAGRIGREGRKKRGSNSVKFQRPSLK